MIPIRNKVARTTTLATWQADIQDQNPLLLPKVRAAIQQNTVQPDLLMQEVIRFLYLVAVSNRTLTPSVLVDLAWHEFILFTKAYSLFCTNYLGRFIHHSPDSNTTQNHKNYIRTIQLYITTFGCPPEQIWGSEAIQEWNDAQCGACSTN